MSGARPRGRPVGAPDAGPLLEEIARYRAAGGLSEARLAAAAGFAPGRIAVIRTAGTCPESTAAALRQAMADHPPRPAGSGAGGPVRGDVRVAKFGSGYAVWRDGLRITGAVASHEEAMGVAERKIAQARQRKRPCISCGTTIRSEGPHHRMCRQCRAQSDPTGGPDHLLMPTDGRGI